MPPDDHAARSGGTAPQAAGAPSNLALRVASAAVMGPLALATAYWGGWVFLAFWTAAAVVIHWEWSGLVTGRSQPAATALGGAALVAAGVVAGLGRPGIAVGLVALGAVLSGLVAAGPRGWVAGGVVYAAAALFGSALLRADPALGLIALLFLFAVVWATDIVAYFCGRAVGGPLLWPRVSPNKTWSGAVGGLLGAVAAGVGVAYSARIGNLAAVAAVALLLSAISQAGDLFESAVKRRFAAKDASGLIPGHGGLMDRLDGFLFAAIAAALLGIVRHGVDAPAQGLLLW